MVSFAYPNILTNIVAGVLVMGFGIIVGNILAILTKKTMTSFEVERILASQGVHFPFESFVSSLIRYATYIAGLLLGVTFLGLESFFLYAVLFLIIGMLIAFILLAFKDFLPNFVAGFFIHWKKKVNINDKIRMDTTEGKVIAMDLEEVKIKVSDGDVVVIPNVLFARKEVRILKKR